MDAGTGYISCLGSFHCACYQPLGRIASPGSGKRDQICDGRPASLLDSGSFLFLFRFLQPLQEASFACRYVCDSKGRTSFGLNNPVSGYATPLAYPGTVGYAACMKTGPPTVMFEGRVLPSFYGVLPVAEEVGQTCLSTHSPRALFPPLQLLKFTARTLEFDPPLSSSFNS